MFCLDSMFKIAFNKFRQDVAENIDNLITTFLVFSVFDLAFGTVCISKLLVGLPCPFCGLTRAALKLISFDLLEAFSLNPLIYLIIITTILWILNRYFGIACKRLINVFLISILVLSIPVYIYRLIALFPTTEPMTYNNNNLFRNVINLIFNFTGG